jgi:GTPase SAR1 family protein
MKPTTIIIGTQGCGKSTYAKHLVGHHFQKFERLSDFKGQLLKRGTMCLWFDETPLIDDTREADLLRMLTGLKRIVVKIPGHDQKGFPRPRIVACVQGKVEDLPEWVNTPDFEIINLNGGSR